MICDQQKVAMYLKALFEIKKGGINLSPAEQDTIWIGIYEKVDQDGYNPKNLPSLLALIHPDFYYKQATSFERNLRWQPNSRFNGGITPNDRCQANEYTGVECIFNEIPQIRGKCQADHKWPNSLGGPSIIDNRLLLCKFHNGMKSNDISHFNWGVVPNWLKMYLEQIYRLKS